jgi:hypothetical protein
MLHVSFLLSTPPSSRAAWRSARQIRWRIDRELSWLGHFPRPFVVALLVVRMLTRTILTFITRSLKEIPKVLIDSEARLHGVEGGVGLDLGGVNVQLRAPHQAGVDALLQRWHRRSGGRVRTAPGCVSVEWSRSVSSSPYPTPSGRSGDQQQGA